MEVNLRLATLRDLMIQHQLDAYIIPSSDPHQSEYVADHWKSRAWMSGFTGSAGILIITQKKAALWTDSRYFIQAEAELSGTEIKLHRLNIPHAPEHLNWLAEELPTGARVGCDGFLFSAQQIRFMAKKFYKKDISIDSSIDLIKPIWTDRPPLPQGPVFAYELKFAGMSRIDKLTKIRERMKELGADFHFISTLDDISWIFNIRSNTDIAYNPVVIAYTIIGQHEAKLFIDLKKLPETLQNQLSKEGVQIKPYNQILNFLEKIPEPNKILVDYNRISIKLYNAIPPDQILHGPTLSTHMKAQKNPTEIANIKKAMVKDGIALTKLYRWLEKKLLERPVPETELALKLDGFRQTQSDYHGESFAAIAGYQSNGAIVHYRPEADKCAKIENEGILLLDSGGQYSDGTTDITRTTSLGIPSKEQKYHFTLVLKGHIALAQLKFLYGTRGNQMEILARQFLWQNGLNYGHGTGHGVGFFLNVHEGPQAFGSGAAAKAATPFEVGMLTSNEPGFYKKGEYGIRIENLLLTIEAEETEFGNFLQFETVSLFPIDLQLIEKQMLSNSEKAWLNAYHKKVYEKLSPLLSVEEAIWLKEKCRSI